MTVRGKKRTANRSRVAKAKYVVETHCTNGNVFLHGPFNSKTGAEDYIEEAKHEEFTRIQPFGTNAGEYKVRAIMHPDKWTSLNG